MSVYPNWLPGMKVTAARLRDGIETVIVKPATTTRASTTALADDPDLTFSAAANAIYHVRFWCMFGSTTAADVKTAWTVPSGVTGNRTVDGPGSTASDASADNIAMRAGAHAYTTSITYSGVRNNVSNHFRVEEEAIVTVGSSAGTIALQWAQVASTADLTQLRADSAMFVRRIG